MNTPAFKSALAPNSVGLEITVAKIPASEKDLEESLWRHVDEQHLPVETRHRLTENGFRCALIGMQLPESLVRILENDTSAASEDPEEAVRRGGDQTWRERQQAQSGRRYRIVTTSVRDRIDVMTRESGAVRGRTYRDAHCEFALRTYPQGDGSVRVELVPEIYHGAAKQTFVGNDRGFIMEAKQENIVLDELRLQATLLPGQSLLLSSTPEQIGVGHQFFAQSQNVDAPSKLLVIRVTRTQHDDLFAPEELLTPLATPAD